jgi:hypothetical protein
MVLPLFLRVWGSAPVRCTVQQPAGMPQWQLRAGISVGLAGIELSMQKAAVLKNAGL